MFLHLHLYSAYSLAEGAVRIKEIVNLAKKNKMPAVAITDRGNMFGALEFAVECVNSGIQPIIGCQIPVKINNDINFIGLIAKDETGYKNLMSLATKLYLDESCHQNQSVSLDDIKSCSEGIIALSGFVDGLIGNLLQKNQLDNAKQLLLNLLEIFPQRFYMEIQRHGLALEMQLEPLFIDLAYEFNIPLLATNAVYFSDKSMFEAHDALLCIAQGRYVDETDRPKVTPNHYFKSQQEMMDLFSDLPEAIQNTVTLAKRCHYIPKPHPPILPNYATDGLSEEILLKQKSEDGLRLRLNNEVFKNLTLEPKDEIEQKYFQRLEYELGIINKMGFAGYFLIVSDFIQWAKSQKIPVGPGRGSGAGSLVAWSLTITDIDPIRFNLLFERFLNPERVSMPDFDIDFCQDRRDEVIKYVQEKYGFDRVAHIITFGKLQARAVLRDVGRVLQMPYGQVDKICKLIPNNPANPVNLEQALEMEPSLYQMASQDETVERLINIAKKLEGLYRHASTHAAGVVIGDRPLTQLVPLYKDEGSQLPATQFNMKYAEMAGLVKFDFLGLKTLTIIEKASLLIRKNYNLDFDIHNINLDDKKTFDLLCRVETVGVFQIEGAGMKDVLKKLQPDRLEDIIALVALYRPGPMDDIPRYMACKHGLEEIFYLHPSLKPILEPTYGVMVYQEQVMEIAQVLGGYSLGAADLLRRAMGKKIKSEMDAQKDLFIKGAIKNGIRSDIAEQIFEQMAKFAGYGFNKSHSAPYGLLTYQTAFLKANYPLEFFAATMTYDMHNTDKLNIYKQDLKRAGIKLLPPDVNHSYVDFTVEGDAIRYGLAAIKNLGVNSMEALVENRNLYGKFKNLTDLLKRLGSKNINKRMLESLSASGSLDSIISNRRQIFDNTETITRYLQGLEKTSNSKQKTLFKDQNDQQLVLPDTNNDWGYLDKLNKEFDALGFYFSQHPLQIYKKQLNNYDVVKSVDIHTLKDNQRIFLAGMVMQKAEKTSKAGKKFAFAQFSDEDGLFECVFFSEVYSRYKDLLTVGRPLIIEVVTRVVDGEKVKMSANKIEELKDLSKNIILKAHQNFNSEHIINFIKNLQSGDNKIKVELNLEDSKVTFDLQDLYEWNPLLEEKAKVICDVVIN